MDAECMKKCPYCAEMIREEAVKCRYCGSSLGGRSPITGPSASPQYWQRVQEGKFIAGVCTGIARQFDAPILVLPLRLFFLMTTIFYLFGLILYIILWFLMPPPPVDSSNHGSRANTPPSPPPPVRGDSCPPVSEEPSRGASAPKEPSSGEAAIEEPPRGFVPSEAPPQGESASHPAQRGKSGLGSGVLLMLFFACGLFILIMLNNDQHLQRFFSNALPIMEWTKLLLIAGVVLFILAGMGFVALGIIPLALVGVGSVLFLRSMHVLSPEWIVITLLAAAIMLIIFSGLRLFHRQPKATKNGACKQSII